MNKYTDTIIYTVFVQDCSSNAYVHEIDTALANSAALIDKMYEHRYTAFERLYTMYVVGNYIW